MASELVERLGLRPHPEGGWYRETWRSPVMFEPDGYDGPRHAATAIYFLLHPGEKSAWHVVRSAELWFWHSGGPLLLRRGGSGDEPGGDEPGGSEPGDGEPGGGDEVLLGPDVAAGQEPQVLIPPGVWQAAEPAGDEPVLVSCVVAPGFDFADFRML
jgi:predicted cupin superfamily sugar epimerase